MGLLDDMVKLQWGKPMAEAIGGIGTTIRERAAQERLAPILAKFQSQYETLPTVPTATGGQVTDVESLSKYVGEALSTAGTFVGPELFGTAAYQNTLKNLETLSSQIAGGVKTKAEAQEKYAQTLREVQEAGRLKAETTEQEAQTAQLNKFVEEKHRQYFPFDTTKMTYRQALIAAKMDEPYIQPEVERLRMSLLREQRDIERAKDITELKNRFIVPALAGDSRYLENVNIDKYLLNNDINAIVLEIMKKKYPGLEMDSPAAKQYYDEIQGKLLKGYQNYSRESTTSSQFKEAGTLNYWANAYAAALGGQLGQPGAQSFGAFLYRSGVQGAEAFLTPEERQLIELQDEMKKKTAGVTDTTGGATITTGAPRRAGQVTPPPKISGSDEELSSLMLSIFNMLTPENKMRLQEKMNKGK